MTFNAGGQKICGRSPSHLRPERLRSRALVSLRPSLLQSPPSAIVYIPSRDNGCCLIATSATRHLICLDAPLIAGRNPLLRLGCWLVDRAHAPHG